MPNRANCVDDEFRRKPETRRVFRIANGTSAEFAQRTRQLRFSGSGVDCTVDAAAR
jgi:hypothetical protein